MSNKNNIVLTIAGSDPSGGAGMQADLRVFAALNVIGVSAITALTVQNSQGVQSVHPVAPEILSAQIEAVLSDSTVDAVKIGMLGGAAQVRVVAKMLRRFKPPNVVLDPVLASTGGIPLLDEAGQQALLTELVPLCDLITPNIEELSMLAELPVETAEERLAAARKLLSYGALHVLVKGGHLSGSPDDTLIDAAGTAQVFKGRRLATPHTHGTGCFLSSAIAAYLAWKLKMPESVEEAKLVLWCSLCAEPIRIGKGRGYPDASLADLSDSMLHTERLRLLRGLYVLTDSTLRPDRTPIEIVSTALDGGAQVIQLREKRLSTPDLILLATQLRALAYRADALFIVNDRVDVALAANADGVHLGPDDMRPEQARRLLGPGKIIGVSVSTVEEAKEREHYASYLAVGAIFGSKTKGDAGEPVGLERIAEIKKAFAEYPLVAIGGINAENIAEVAAAGADSAAVISAVVAAPDMRAATEELVKRFQGGTKTKWTTG